jgi:hypothetical protein
MRAGKRKLLISTQLNHQGDIDKKTISSWIRQLLIHCYQNPTKKAVELVGTGTHEIRRMATTLVFRGSTSIEDLLTAGWWKNHTTFTDFYLKDLSLINGDDLKSLGPIVAGKQVVLNTNIAGKV